MANLSRRDFLKTAGLATAASLGVKPKKLQAAPKNVLADDRYGVLVDTTVCIGCRRCELACLREHGLPFQSEQQFDDRSVFQQARRPDYDQLTVVNAYPNPRDDLMPVYVKVQCMHCDYPACVSACIVGAFSKQETGAVIWDESKCIGCRYCLIACPFQVPAFEYHKAIQPQVVKCDFCYPTRTSRGKPPACVEACPQQALIFGKRYELLKLAKEKIKANPDRYLPHVYGEKEVGGTGWLYLAGQSFASLDFPKLGTKPAPGATEPLQHALFKYFIPPLSLYALLGGIMWLGNRQKGEEQEE